MCQHDTFTYFKSPVDGEDVHVRICQHCHDLEIQQKPSLTWARMPQVEPPLTPEPGVPA